MNKWLENLIGGWVIKKGLAKATKQAASVAVGLVAAVLAKSQVQVWLTNLGVTIDPQQLEAGITLAVTSLVTMGLNWAKIRFNLKFL